MGRTLIVIGFVALFVLHQDFWNWDNRELVFGFLPAGLAYHALFSVAAALLWVAAVKWAWPQTIEDWGDETQDEAAEQAAADSGAEGGQA